MARFFQYGRSFAPFRMTFLLPRSSNLALAFPGLIWMNGIGSNLTNDLKNPLSVVERGFFKSNNLWNLD
jgi:hypothetical protein